MEARQRNLSRSWNPGASPSGSRLGRVIERSGGPKIEGKVLGSRSRLSEKSKLDLEDQSLAGGLR